MVQRLSYQSFNLEGNVVTIILKFSELAMK